MKKYLSTAALLVLAIFIPVALGSIHFSSHVHEYGFPFPFLILTFRSTENEMFSSSDAFNGFKPIGFAAYLVIASIFAFWAGSIWSRSK